MIPPFFPWFLAFLLLIACVALLVLLLRYRDRSVRLEAESRSWQKRGCKASASRPIMTWIPANRPSSPC